MSSVCPEPVPEHRMESLIQKADQVLDALSSGGAESSTGKGESRLQTRHFLVLFWPKEEVRRTSSQPVRPEVQNRQGSTTFLHISVEHLQATLCFCGIWSSEPAPSSRADPEPRKKRSRPGLCFSASGVGAEDLLLSSPPRRPSVSL